MSKQNISKAQIMQAQIMQDRLVGVAISVGSLKSDKNIGVGEFADLAEFGVLCAKLGIKLIQLLPVNDTGYTSSPYSALTAFGLHPLYLRISDLPEYLESDIEVIKKKFDGMPRFNYEDLLRAKMDLLRKIYTANKDQIAASPELKDWVEKNSWVKAYAVFRRLKEANNERSWRDWGAKNGGVELWDDPELKSEHLFWAWIQQALDTQFSAAAGTGSSVKGW